MKFLPKLLEAIVVENLESINIKNADDTIESLLLIPVWNLDGFVDAFDDPSEKTIVNCFGQRVASEFGLRLVVTLLHNVSVRGDYSRGQGRRHLVLGHHQHLRERFRLALVLDDNLLLLRAELDIAQMQNRRDRSPDAVDFFDGESEGFEGECRRLIVGFLGERLGRSLIGVMVVGWIACQIKLLQLGVGRTTQKLLSEAVYSLSITIAIIPYITVSLV